MKKIPFLRKELSLQLRSGGYLLPSCLFSILLYAGLRFSLPQDYLPSFESISIFWFIHTISFTFLLFASQEWEHEWHASDMLKVLHIPALVIFIVKVFALWLAQSLLLVGTLLPWLLFFKPPEVATIPVLALVGPYLVSSANLAFVGTLAAMIAVHSAHRQIMQNLIYFPLLIPNFIASSGLYRTLLSTGEIPLGELYLMIALFFFYLCISYLLVPILWEE